MSFLVALKTQSAAIGRGQIVAEKQAQDLVVSQTEEKAWYTASPNLIQ